MSIDVRVFKDLIEQSCGVLEDVIVTQDGHGAAVASFPLRKDHWIYDECHDVPPAPWRTGTSNKDRQLLEESVRIAAKYAIRSATMNGKIVDFDPDAMVQNFIVGMLGYFTPDGFSHL